MNENLIKRSMPVFEGKKVLNVGVKVNDELRRELQAICDAEDRPMSYVVRELAVRGLALYKQDGRLKTTETEEKILTAGKQPNTDSDIKDGKIVIQRLDVSLEPIRHRGEAATDIKPPKPKKKAS